MTTASPRDIDPPAPDPAEPLLPIAVVERETGLGKDTLRAWERRYGFPQPRRDAAGVRGYPRAMVERLRLVRRALLNGHRPGRLLALPPQELDAVLAALAVAPPVAEPSAIALTPLHAPQAEPLALADCIAALRTGSDVLRHWLTRGLARLGLASFVVDGVAPLTAQVGNAWLAGTIAVYEEHLYSEVVQGVLRAGMLPFQAGLDASGPRVLLTTVPGEAHGLGLLMAEALMTLEACRCVALGPQTPLDDIAAAARAHRIDIVALSFSESLPGPQALAALADLRARLPAAVEVWAGGGATALRAAAAPGLRVMQRLVDIPQAVADWRRNRPAGAR
jgi:hypothetical protein